MSKSDKIQIDPDKFARAVVSGSSLTNDDDEKASKQALTRYLTAYLLVSKFNKLEAKQFSPFKNTDIPRMLDALEKSIND